MRILLIVAALFLGACGTTPTVPVETIKTVYVEKPISCPSKEERERLRALRPNALSSQPMPATPGERVAQITAQLGMYEAPGGYADQVDTALDRCQVP